jgi:hypothetical protein
MKVDSYSIPLVLMILLLSPGVRFGAGDDLERLKIGGDAVSLGDEGNMLGDVEEGEFSFRVVVPGDWASVVGVGVVP